MEAAWQKRFAIIASLKWYLNEVKIEAAQSHLHEDYEVQTQNLRPLCDLCLESGRVRLLKINNIFKALTVKQFFSIFGHKGLKLGSEMTWI